MAQLRSDMGHDEFMLWVAYYGRKAQARELAAQKEAARK